VSLVAGDRQSDGIFPLWSIARNISVRSLRDMLRRLLIDPSAENRWRRNGRSAFPSARLTSTTRSCRCRAATSKRCCSPARWGPTPKIILMDDPMRGVDVGTKGEVYRLIREEAGKGRTFSSGTRPRWTS
jgi:ribose transport system ATP-binding protein